ncbi:uncharacterized protein LOC131605084 [Vicia villosa]|uniref:uncharacterized protein LOC131605084 n=1 Tax=Vicia villosa TaxID=3911 RepID=UPI00273C4AE7|nr:uncharacterized protein LOC131605084 [Vicia villosa]
MKLDKPTATKKIDQPKTVEDLAHGDKEVAQGMSKKRTQETLLENNREKIQKVDKAVGKNVPISSKNKKLENPNLSLDTVMSKTQCSKKSKRVPTCLSMLIGDYIELQNSKGIDATKSNNGEKSSNNCQPLSSVNRRGDLRQPEGMEGVVQVEENINEETNTNREEDKGTLKRRTRGKTLCKKIHGRNLEENSTFCPLIYTNWSGMPRKNKRRFWRYTQRKFILPIEARNWVVTTVRDAWRRYKHKIKKNHFLKYSNMTERLKHRPPKVPEAHFRNLCEYWNKEPVQVISEKNTNNRAQLKWVHRMGPKNFSLIREKLRAKEEREPTQSEIFVETRKGNKGKEMDAETEKIISQLQKTVENEESDTEAFEAVFGKERPGRVRCYGRNITKTSLKQKSEINALKKVHNEEVSTLRHDFEDKIDRLQNAFKTLMQHCNP